MFRTRLPVGLIVAALAVVPPNAVVGQSILVDDLELTTEIGSYESPADIKFTADGTLWACNKRGILTVSDPGNYDSPRRVLDLRDIACENGERGLLGVAPHFDFGTTNPHVYIMYTYKKSGNCNENGNNGPVMRLSRFTCDAAGDLSCDIDSEEVYLESPPFPYDHHNAGAIAFGKDNLIYATIGDGGESPEAQDRTNLFGVVVRLTPENTIPPDNPYTDPGTSVRCGTMGGKSRNGERCQEIFAYGLRNPFRFAMNPNKATTEFYVNDVGASLWEEVSIGGDGYKGANYGWPIREGPCKKGSDCGTLCIRDDDYVEPEHFYHHDGNGEGAITAGTFVPEGIWPSEYDGKYLYADYVFGRIYVMEPGGREDRDTCPMASDYDPVSILRYPESFMSAMAFSPFDNALYFLIRGHGGRLNRVRYTGTVNRSPQPMIKTSALGGEVGTTIEFDASGSTDPDGHDLLYEWDFDGDGLVDSTDVVASFTYNQTGVYEVTLKVRDGNGGRPSASISIGIGSHPIAEILEPEEGSDFYVGQEFILTGTASGEGATDEDEAFLWEVKQHHANHFHPYLEPTTGNRVRLQPAPSPEDFEASENSYLEVILTVTNTFGLKTTVSRNVMPRLLNVSLSSIPGGRTVLVDEFEVETPRTFISWANHPLKLKAIGEDWTEWSNGGEQSQVVTLTETSNEVVSFTAFFNVTSSFASASPTTASPTTLSPTLSFAPTLNSEPLAIIKSSALGGDLGSIIAFNATESKDVDGQKLSFSWDFDGDGVVDSTEPVTSFQYNQAGVFLVTLTVTDGNGAVSSASVDIGIAVFPTATIVEPVEGSKFYVGEELVLRGSASGEGMEGDESEWMTWLVNQHVGTFFSPYLKETVGNNVKVPPAPKPQPLLVAESSYLEVILRVTNKFGMSSTVSRIVTPMVRSVILSSVPPGRVIQVDDVFVTTPTTFVSWANQDLSLQAVGEDWYGWSDGGEQVHTLTLAPGGDVENYTLVALFESPTGPIGDNDNAATLAPSMDVPTNDGGNITANPDPSSSTGTCLLCEAVCCVIIVAVNTFVMM